MADLNRIEHITTVETTKRYAMKLTGDEIIRMVNFWRGRHGLAKIPEEGVDVLVGVPGGGDWSNKELDIDARTPVELRWKTHEVEED